MENAKDLRKIASETYDREKNYAYFKEHLLAKAKEGRFRCDFPINGHKLHLESVRDLLEAEGFKIKQVDKENHIEISW